MFLNKVDLRSFRNYEHVQLTFNSGVNVFIGDNGQGKTNLLEAISLLGFGQSFRPSQNETLIQSGRERAWIKCELEKKGLYFQVQVGIEKTKRSFFINEKSASSRTVVEKFPCVLFSPESLTSIKAGPEERRTLIDQFLLLHSHQHIKVLADFKRCLRTRNRILRDYKRGFTPKNEFYALLESINKSYLPLAADLSMARVLALRDLQPDIEKIVKFILNLPAVDISVDYLISDASVIDWSYPQIYDALQNRLANLQSAEIEKGTSLVGPHKQDIRFILDGKNSRFYCSQGQQRTIILAFKMAQIMYHHRVHQDYPFLLLDDVLSELDHEKRHNLVGFLNEIKSQIFITTTDMSFLPELKNNLSVFAIKNGSIEQAG